MKEWERDGKRKKEGVCELQIKHILPKANQIVKTAEQVVKSLYPFEVTPPAPSQHLTVPFTSLPYEHSSRYPRTKFSPSRPCVSAYFDPGSLIYDKFNGCGGRGSPVNLFSIDKLKSLSKNDFILPTERTAAFCSPHDNLDFHSRFESGNLAAAAHADGLYCLLLHNDVNTTGYTNWFYFAVTSRLPLRGRLAIMNYGKAGWPLNLFPGVCVWSGEGGWRRHGLNLQCEANSVLFPRSQDYSNFNTLYFEYEFQEAQTVYFAYNPPYTYTDLLAQLDALDERKLTYFHRKLAGTSLLGNRLEMLTVTNFDRLRRGELDLPVVVLLARTHAGETVSSWIMHHFIHYLVGDSQQARTLRDNFVFKIFPMVNPDGVIHGNYRCSLIGRDLNRRWKNPLKEYYPEIYYIKNQIMDTFEKKQIKMVLDLHGHTQKRKSFFYGCTDKNYPHRTRLFPYLASKLSPHFEFASCNFAMEKSKEATARITLYNLIKSPDIFTIETSQFGMNDRFLNSEALQEIAVTLAKAICKYYKLEKVGDVRTEMDDCEEEMLGNPALMKVGCDPSDGSDSEPSLCNLNFDKINKLSQNLTARPASENNAKKKAQPPLRPQSYKKPSSKNIRQEIIFSTDKSRDISGRELSPSAPMRGSTAVTQRREKAKGKLRTPKLEFTKEMQSIGKLGQMTTGDIQKRPLRMINFELLIDESGKRKSSLREEGLESLDFRLNHPNYHMFQKRCMFRNRSYNWNKNSV